MKISGMVITLAGITLGATGSLMAFSNDTNSVAPEIYGGALALTGGAMVLTGVPLWAIGAALDQSDRSRPSPAGVRSA